MDNDNRVVAVCVNVGSMRNKRSPSTVVCIKEDGMHPCVRITVCQDGLDIREVFAAYCEAIGDGAERNVAFFVPTTGQTIDPLEDDLSFRNGGGEFWLEPTFLAFVKLAP